jgi:hypothetical protein
MSDDVPLKVRPWRADRLFAVETLEPRGFSRLSGQ